MLLPEQVVPFLQHDDPMVREHAHRYFRNSYDFGPLTAEHYWAVIDRWGENDETLSFAAALERLPQTDGSLRRLVQALASNASENFEFHYQRAARDMELAILGRNREELLACPRLLPHVREHLELRLRLIDQPAASAWDRLMTHGRELRGANALTFNASLSDALIEAAARGGTEICQQAMAMLGDESAAEDWREIFAVRVLGQARHQPAIDALVEKLAIDADVLREEVNRALSRIASLRVVERIVDFYPGKPWHVRLYANSSLPTFKRPESVNALLKFLDLELAMMAEPEDDEGEPLVDAVLLDLTELGSLAGLEESRRWIERFPTDPEAIDLCECLLATAVMTGVTLPEESDWRRRLKKHNDRMAMRGAGHGAFFGDMREEWRKTGISIPPEDGTHDEPEVNTPSSVRPFADDPPERPMPFRKAAPKIGRNEPCPCGSGKKFKKCCGKR